uniref:Peroxisomal membrane protein 2 n=1 Tax=Chenopodium quinoa TaxID=63459 RepID=A0A803MH82_CHEQI
MASLPSISPKSLPPLTKPLKPTKTQKPFTQLPLPTTFRRSSAVTSAVSGDDFGIIPAKSSKLAEQIESAVSVLQESEIVGGGAVVDLDKMIDRIINASIVLAAGSFALTKLLTIDHDYWQGWTIYEILRYAPQHNWSAYEEILKTNPVLAKMVISGVVYSIGDWIAQCYEGKPLFEFDRTRMLRSGLAGFALHGSLSHYYYEFCEALFPFQDWWAVPIKVAFDQTIWAGIWNSIYFIVLGLLRLESPVSIFKELKGTFLPMLTAGWKLWPFAHLVTYGVIPIEQRLLWVDCVELIWVTILSTLSNQKSEARLSEESTETTNSSPSEE